MKHLLAAYLLALSVTEACAFVSYFNGSGQPLRWNLQSVDGRVHPNVVNPNTLAIRYFLASDAYSPTNTANELNAMRAAFAQWQSIQHTRLKFEDAGLVAPGVDINTQDNTNVVFWIRGSTMVNGGMDNIASAKAVTFTRYFNDHVFSEADIVFNGNSGWYTDFAQTASSQSFIEGYATHEIGHLIGLDHSPGGGATMFPRGGTGVGVIAGLSADEVAAAKWLYGTNGAAPLATVRGVVRMNGGAVYGAIVAAEDAAGNLTSITATQPNGEYSMPALLPGTYKLRVSPLDAVNATFQILSARDIPLDNFNNVITAFSPTEEVTVALTGGSTTSRDFSVTAGEPAFRIIRIRTPTTNANSFNNINFGTSIQVGQSNLIVGVMGLTVPTNNATLSISGDGITVGPTIFTSPNGSRFVSTTISVSSNATPGLRTFTLRQGNDIAYANGYLDILPAAPDYNFDGLDDRFQRQYFPLFTATNAAPAADPDGDGYSNLAEYIAGSVPTNTLSVLQVQSVQLTTNGSTITWNSAAGKRYQVLSRRDIANDPWVNVGNVVIASGSSTQFLDTTATNEFKFYRIQALP